MARDPIKFQEIADPQTFKWFSGLYTRLGELITSVKGIRVDLPKIYNIQGSVKVDSLPPLNINNFPDLSSAFKAIAIGINNMQEAIIKAVSSQKLQIPDSTSISGDVSMKGTQEILDGLEGLAQGLNVLVKVTQEVRGASADKPLQVEIIKDLPRPMVNPVTNVSINGLGGFFQSTQVTVTPALTVLPPSALSNRRSIIIYNNGSQTVEIGGSTFTFGNGLPIAAGTYSPALDISAKLIIYGRVTSGSADVRVGEASDIATGR